MATLFRLQKELKEGGGKLEALNPESTAPKHKRRRVIPEKVKNLIIEKRFREKIGKEKLSRLLKEDNIGIYSPSTVGRILVDLKKRGELQNIVNVFIEWQNRQDDREKATQNKREITQ